MKRKLPTVELIKVSGKITDEKGNPIAGATVIIHGTSQGVATDVDGKYTLPVKPDRCIANFIYRIQNRSGTC